MPPVGHHYWALLLPWNHYSLPFHPNVPLFGVHGYDETKWTESDAQLDAIGEGDEGADRPQKKEGEELSWEAKAKAQADEIAQLRAQAAGSAAGGAAGGAGGTRMGAGHG